MGGSRGKIAGLALGTTLGSGKVFFPTRGSRERSSGHLPLVSVVKGGRRKRVTGAVLRTFVGAAVGLGRGSPPRCRGTERRARDEHVERGPRRNSEGCPQFPVRGASC